MSCVAKTPRPEVFLLGQLLQTTLKGVKWFGASRICAPITAEAVGGLLSSRVPPGAPHAKGGRVFQSVLFASSSYFPKRLLEANRSAPSNSPPFITSLILTPIVIGYRYDFCI